MYLNQIINSSAESRAKITPLILKRRYFWNFETRPQVTQTDRFPIFRLVRPRSERFQQPLENLSYFSLL